MTIQVNSITKKYSAKYIVLSTEEFPFAVVNIRKDSYALPQLIKQAVVDFTGEHDLKEIVYDAKAEELDVLTSYGVTRSYQVREVHSYE